MDGSAHGGILMGGAAFVVTEGDPETPHELASVSRKGTLCTCSYEEEVEAMKMASTSTYNGSPATQKSQETTGQTMRQRRG